MIEEDVTDNESEPENIGVGALRIETNPEESTVYIDSVIKGTTPVTFKDVNPGTYNITLSLIDHQAHNFDVEINEGKIKTVTFDFVLRETTYDEEDLIGGEETPEERAISEHEALEKHLKDMTDVINAKFDDNTKVLNKVYDALDLLRQYVGKQTGFDPGEKYLSSQSLAISASTPDRPENYDVVAPNGPGGTGYDIIEINKIKGSNSRSISVINDGSANLFIIATIDGVTWSKEESGVLVGESRIFHNAYELRIRSPSKGNLAAGTGGIYRYTEYDYSLSYSNITLTATANRPGISAQTLTAPQAGTMLPNLVVPNQFRLIIKADPSNSGIVYVSDTVPNSQVAATRIPLSAGDAIGYFVTNANTIAVSADSPGQLVGITSEQ